MQMKDEDLETFLFDYYYDITDCEEYPTELTLPLEQRADLLEKLEKYVADIEDINQGDYFNPLMTAVANCDAPMSEYLIEHGASVFYWPEMDEESIDSNYYLNDLDINFFHQSWSGQNFADAIMATAKVIVTKGGYNENYGGFCLKIDTKERGITLNPPRVKF